MNREEGLAAGADVVVGGEDGYGTIQAGVDEASAGDTVEVGPDTYREQVRIEESITLVAPRGATLDGSTLGASTRGTAYGKDVGKDTRGITISGTRTEPEIVGFTVTGYETAIEADGTAGAWKLRDVLLERNGDDGISAVASEGAWSVHDATIRLNVEEGIDAERSRGDWSLVGSVVERNGDDGIDADGPDTPAAWDIRDCTIRHNTDHGLELKQSEGAWTIRDTRICDNNYGVGARGTSGDWTIANSSIDGNHFVGVNVVQSSADWTIRGTSIRDSCMGVWAPATSGDWRVEDSFVGETYYVPNDLKGEGTGIFAPESTGDWSVEGSAFGDLRHHALDATAAAAGDATGNWWDRIAGEDCVGNVDCGKQLSERPDRGNWDRDSRPAGDATTAGSSTARAENVGKSPSELSAVELTDLLLERLGESR